MTHDVDSSPQSMRYSLDEVLSGMLGSIARDEFTDNTERLGALFKSLSQAYPLLAPYAAIAGEADFSAVLVDALGELVKKRWLQHEPGCYALTKRAELPASQARKSYFGPAILSS